MADAKAVAVRKALTTRDAVKKCEGLTEIARASHRSAILAATEAGVSGRELARRLDISEVVLREKLARARLER